MAQALILGTVIGLAVGAGIAVLLDHLIGAIHGPEEVAMVSGSAPLAAVGRIGARNTTTGQVIDSRLVTVTAPRSASAEAFRTLRTNMRLMALEHELRTIVVTSAGAGEGKTLVSANLAVALAQFPVSGWYWSTATSINQRRAPRIGREQHHRHGRRAAA